MALTIKTNTKDFIKALARRRDALPIVGAETVNEGAEMIYNIYQGELKGFTLRNKFTQGAVKLLKSKPVSSSGRVRAVKDINAVVAVRKMKGGKDHYLLDQEVGGTKRGGLQGKVPIPLDSARQSESHKKPISTPLRLTKGLPQELTIGGMRGPRVPFGSDRDRFNDSQRWAILYKYSGKVKGPKNPYGWDLKKPFYFQGLRRGLGVFTLKRRRISMIRTLEKSHLTIRATGKFRRSVDRLTPRKMEEIFKRKAIRYIRD